VVSGLFGGSAMRGRSLSRLSTFKVLLLVDDRSRRVVTLDAVRIVQLANFYGPRSGGLRTAVDQLGAGYTASGHEVVLVVPGERATETILPSGVLRITRPAGKIPFTGGYRAVNPRSTA
jgi:alpha-1,6-mannosyltransferase